MFCYIQKYLKIRLPDIIKKQRKVSKKACGRYQGLSAEGKNIKEIYGCKRYKNLLENEKQRLQPWI